MKVFISWSGTESQGLAEVLRTWLPRVLINGVEAFVSSQDIEKGQRGLNVIAAKLDEIDYGLVLLTKSNQHAPWIVFESGALGKSVGEGRVSPLLIDLTQADVTGPLEQFQMTSLADPEDVWKLVQSINRVVSPPVPEPALKVLFNDAWADLDAAISKARKGSAPAKTSRPADDILDEILFRVRRIERNADNQPSRLGPSGLTRAQEGEMVADAFMAISAAEPSEVRGGVKVGKRGAIIALSVPKDARLDTDELQRVADTHNARIEVSPMNVVIEPSDPEHTEKAWG